MKFVALWKILSFIPLYTLFIPILSQSLEMEEIVAILRIAENRLFFAVISTFGVVWSTQSFNAFQILIIAQERRYKK